MATAQSTRRELSDEELADLLVLTKKADTVELKLTVPEAGHRSAIGGLGLDPLAAQIRQVYFFDTPDLALDRAGVVLRGRRVQQRGHDSVVKLRPAVPSELPAELRRSPSFGVEVDAMPGGFVCSASMKGALAPKDDVHNYLGEGRQLRKLFSKEQRAFFSTHAPAGVGFEDLSILGPIFVLKLKFAPQGFDRKMVAEIWLYPDDSRILELSTKCTPAETFQVVAEAKAFLAKNGITTIGEQQAKTRKALEFFSKRLAKA
ncbi:MAG TPA: hypothetical protein VFD90_00360 [Gaiellales bacterium]|jgi:hypothetical protein|nr:hypothetical protein [Gaiellales bacterium]